MNLLSPLTNCRPCRRGITKILAWLVMGFGLFVIILGYVVRDDMPAAAQTVNETVPLANESQTAPEAAPNQAQAAPETAPNQAQAAPGAAPNQAQAAPETAPNQAQAAPGAAPNQAQAASETAPNQAQAAPEAAPNQAQAAPEAAPNQAQAAPNQAQAAPGAAPNQAQAESTPEEISKKYNVAEGVKYSGNQALIEKKKSEDTTSIFSRIMSIFGIFAFVGIAWLLSSKKKKVLWRLVAVGMSIQLVFAIFILWTPVGRAIFEWLNDAFTVLINFTNAGTTFLFSSFAAGVIESPLVNTAMSILPPIIFFSSLMTVLYYLGIMQWIVRGMAVFMMKFMGTSGSESLSSVANIFVGMTEAPLVVKPFVEKMTQSELFAIMTGGMATVAGGTMAAYVAMLQPFFPDIAGHLIAASVMSAPASLVVAKIMMPETEESETMGKVKFELPKTDANVIDAAARGAGEGLHLALNVAAMLLAFVAIIALINYILGLPSRLVNANTYEHVAGYVVSSGGKLDPACDSIYSSSDTISCTHGALLQLAEIRGIQVDESLKKLLGEQSDKIETTEKLYDAVLANVAGTTPNEHAAALTDCRDSHNIAACGALLSQTQSETWTPTLEKKTMLPLLSLETIFGWIFFPFAFLMGVPLSDCFLVGQLIGEKTAVNEFVAYLHLARVVDQLSYRSIVISTYALCGFANFGSIAIQIGGIGGMAPKRRSDIAKLGIKAMIAGTIAAFMTATIAGALI